jgi:cytochrome c oxidase subunit 2
MQILFIVAILALGFLIVFQIAKASEYVSVLRGEEKTRKQNNRVNAFLLLMFLIFGLLGVYYCNERLAGKTLAFGSADSDHGLLIDQMMEITLWITGFVFVITQVALFWFAYKYQESETRKPYYYPHNNRLEVIWTVIPAIALTVLVGFGIIYWFKITGEAPDKAMKVEITGSQFKWEIRYPGKDGVLGKKFYKLYNAESNPLGQVWEDVNNHDDVIITNEMHLVVNKPVKLIINAKDVIHDVGLAHFRMKMDAVPGTPTTMWFTPNRTSKQKKEETGNPEFTYEISCDQMCGQGHTKMRGTVIVETQEEFDIWMASQKPQYVTVMEAKQKKEAKSDSTVTVNKPVAQVEMSKGLLTGKK